jgi:hypothetical protein
MSVSQNKINGIDQTLSQALVGSFSVLSSGLDQNANTTLNNVEVQNYPDGGNIIIGELAMSSALNNPLTNIAIGYNALPSVDGSTLNSDNIAIGQESLYNVTTGGKNIGIGLNALNGLLTGTNTIGIGNNTVASASNGIIIGNNAELTNNNSGILKFNSVTPNTTYPAANEFWFGDTTTGWIDVKAGDMYVDNLDVSGALTTGTLSLNSLQVTSDTGKLDIIVRNQTYDNSLNRIDEIRNTSSFRNKYGPIAFIADVSGVSASATDPILREKILFGYQQGIKAIEINNFGAISLDSVNSGNPLPALTSNYGITGQVLTSQGSSSNAKWSTISDISGVIGLNNRNLQGITFVRDLSGNLDSSSNFIYDGSGINIISSKNSQLNGLRIQNTSTGVSAASNLTLKNSANTATLEFKSTGYTAGTTIDASSNVLTISNPSGSISTNSGNKTLFGYSSNTRAIEISSSGALSFDTSNNSGTFVSNYGNVGQVLSSQGSSAPPKWSTINFAGFPKIIYVDSSQYFPGFTDTSGTLFSYVDASGLTAGKTRIITFTTTLTIGSGSNITYSLFINGISVKSFNIKSAVNSSMQRVIQFLYSNSNTSELINIKFDAFGNTVTIDPFDIYSFRMEEIQ